MKKYESYKDSGIEWIGEIPSHWEIFNLKFILRENIKDGPHETPVWFDDGIPFLSIDGIVNGEISFDKCRYIDEVQYENFSRKLVVEMDDIFIGKAASIGKIARVKTNRKFTVWSPIAVVKVRRDYNPTFVEYFFKSDIIQHQIEIFSTSNTQKNIAMGDIPKMKFISPSCYEQINIANYLDHKTTQIDDLIAKKERLIQLLDEERVAVINQAVTKGLNLNVPMKDSGIEWLGEIPSHWDITSLKLLSKIQNGSTPSSSIEEYWDGNVNWVTTDDLGKLENKSIKSTRRRITNAGYKSCGTSLAPIGSIVISTRAPIGHIGILEIEACTNQGCKTVIPISIYSNFCYWFLLNAKDVLASLGQGSTFKELPTSTLKDFKIVFPKIEEQTIIANYLDHKTTQIDDLIAKAQQEIESLKEYKTALISEVVTGKVDVRN